MGKWWKETILLMIIAIATLKIHNLNAIARNVDQDNKLSDKQGLLKFNHELQNPFLLVRDGNSCLQLNKDYREIYGFETQNFYINICQYGQQFIYYRQSKADRHDIVMIPAETVFGGQVFQASEGKITYFVGIDSNGYYSSVMKNDNQLVVEPQIKTPTTTIGKTFDNSTEIDRQSKMTASELDLNDYAKTNNNWRVCTQKKQDFHPRLNGWQKFIGESPDIAFNYAANNGHKFAYNDDDFQEASIQTTDGLIVTLNIASIDRTIGRVCVNPLVSSYSRL
jgi:hypothetical protein